MTNFRSNEQMTIGEFRELKVGDWIRTSLGDEYQIVKTQWLNDHVFPVRYCIYCTNPLPMPILDMCADLIEHIYR